MEATNIRRRYYHHQGSLSKKQQTIKKAGGLICMGIWMTFVGLVVYIFVSWAGFGNVFGPGPFIMPIVFFVLGPILLTIGLALYSEAKKMPEEESPESVIEYVRVSPETKISDLSCPACDAPLDKKPPCKCEYCGRIIRSI